jgi:hypothetical protein
MLRLGFQSEPVTLAVNDGVFDTHDLIQTRLSDYARLVRLSPAAYIAYLKEGVLRRFWDKPEKGQK